MCIACSIAPDPSQFVQTLANMGTAISPVFGYAVLQVYKRFYQSLRKKSAPFILGAAITLIHLGVSSVVAVLNVSDLFQAKVMYRGAMIWFAYVLVILGWMFWTKYKYPWIAQWRVHCIGIVIYSVIALGIWVILDSGEHGVELFNTLWVALQASMIGMCTSMLWIAAAICIDVYVMMRGKSYPHTQA